MPMPMPMPTLEAVLEEYRFGAEWHQRLLRRDIREARSAAVIKRSGRGWVVEVAHQGTVRPENGAPWARRGAWCFRQGGPWFADAKAASKAIEAALAAVWPAEAAEEERQRVSNAATSIVEDEVTSSERMKFEGRVLALSSRGLVIEIGVNSWGYWEPGANLNNTPEWVGWWRTEGDLDMIEAKFPIQ